jgi:thioredoxin reductase (NADPH)
VVQEIKGNQVVRSVLIKNVKTGEIKEFSTDGIFLFVGLIPRTQFLKGLIHMNEEDYIITDENCETSVKGIYAAGDCRKKLLRQIATAVGEGATAAFAAEKYLEGKK